MASEKPTARVAIQALATPLIALLLSVVLVSALFGDVSVTQRYGWLLVGMIALLALFTIAIASLAVAALLSAIPYAIGVAVPLGRYGWNWMNIAITVTMAVCAVFYTAASFGLTPLPETNTSSSPWPFAALFWLLLAWGIRQFMRPSPPD